MADIRVFSFDYARRIARELGATGYQVRETYSGGAWCIASVIFFGDSIPCAVGGCKTMIAQWLRFTGDFQIRRPAIPCRVEAANMDRSNLNAMAVLPVMDINSDLAASRG